ncbi:MAG TPA: GNAT family N-acetyltransferase [Gaiellaceae bacterium]|nr:GNAT family N-acetyltransferase [Gaiellaceae bacterium]
MRAATTCGAGRHEPRHARARRCFGVAVLAYLTVLAGAGLELGTSAARGPDGTMSSELIVDGGRSTARTTVEGKATRARDRRNPRAGKRYSVHLARSVEEVESLRPAWAALQGPNFTSDIDVFLTVTQTVPGVLRPHVLVVEYAGEPVSLVAARLEDARLPARVGYAGFSPRLRMLTVAYGGFLGAGLPDPGVVLDSLGHTLGEPVDLTRMRMLAVGSPLHAAACDRAGVLRRRRFSPPQRHWHGTIPDSFDAFLAAQSKERRRHVRRYQRRLEEAFPGDVEVRTFTTRAELDLLFADTERVQRRTYQRALGVGFSDDELTRRLTELAMDRGWFRGAVLYLRGEPAAFWHGNAYQGTFSTTVTGYDPALAERRPGTYLLMKLVEGLCADPSVRMLDFGFGDADYKRSFGETSTLEEDVVVFEQRPRPLAVNLAESALLGAGALGHKALGRSGYATALRRAWRRRLDPSRSA